MKVLKKARDNDNTALINPAKSSAGCREIISKFSNYDARSARLAAIVALRQNRLSYEACMQPTTSDIVRSDMKGWLECNSLRIEKKKRQSALYVFRELHNTELRTLKPCKVRELSSGSSSFSSFRPSGAAHSNLAERIDGRGCCSGCARASPPDFTCLFSIIFITKAPLR